jgi:hypothetical protein
MGGGTWLWLGSFLFDAGADAGRGAVTVSGLMDGSDVLVDAVRFGGGMGNVARRPADKLISNQWSLNAGSQQSSAEAAPGDPSAQLEAERQTEVPGGSKVLASVCGHA